MSVFQIVASLAEGLGITLKLTLGGSALAIVCALVAGSARAEGKRLVRVLATTYVELFRGTSALVQLFWAYYALPLLGIRFDALATGIVVLGLNSGAYGAEVVRGALRAVPPGQRDAGVALGASRWQIFALIRFPQAVPAMLPPAGNVLIELLKNTSLASLITLSEITFRAQLLRAESLRTVAIFGTLLVVYFVIALVIAGCIHALERGLRRRWGMAAA